MSEISDALEAWRQAYRELAAATPGSAAWLRARVVEEDRREAYQRAAGEPTDFDDPPEPVPVTRSRSPVRR